MSILSLLPQRQHVTFDLFEDLKPNHSPEEAAPPAAAPSDMGLEGDNKPRPRGLSIQRVSLLALGFVAGSAAVWEIETGLDATSVTVALPRAQVPIPASAVQPPARQVSMATSIRPLGAAQARATPLGTHPSAPLAIEGATTRNAKRMSDAPALAERSAAVRRELAAKTSVSAVPPAEITGSRSSRYTSLEPVACTTSESSDASLRRCRGVAGYTVEAADTRPVGYVAIVDPNGTRSELGFSGIAPGGSLGKLAEWRGRSNEAPRALIVRVSSPGKSPVSSLIVAKLGTNPCVVAVIPRGPHQNEKARAVADSSELDCSTG
jgi:hypothetical protein